MKIQRFLASGREHHGRLHDDGRTTLLEGDLYAGLRDTGTPVTVEKLLAPLVPRDILCVGLNYKQHAAESNAEPPAHPVLFMKNSGTLQNPGAERRSPRSARSVPRSSPPTRSPTPTGWRSARS
jgi:2-keto-4-pentenoate hydratase/2-oxohepta-3-ene-1,7-dioic acid hydratase in catechol pathway